MFAVDRNPLAGDNAREHGQMKVHQKTKSGVQFEPPMGFGAMQVNGGAENRYLEDHQRGDRHPQINHSLSKLFGINAVLRRVTFSMITECFQEAF
jgi:hypothetical protein